ncbi:MAG: T9SS type A sorting domain-containing protein [Lewinellaceae bacterium]|nr:T9SS type A sorting domain-containing protein [Lewinellaceae bacterium]
MNRPLGWPDCRVAIFPKGSFGACLLFGVFFSGPGNESFNLAFVGNAVLGDTLLPPFAGQSPAPGAKPYAGIEIHNDPGLKSVGSTGGGANTFKELRNGILVKNTNLFVENSAFTDILADENEPYTLTGFAIRAEGTGLEQLIQKGLGAGGSSTSSFDNCTHTVWASRMMVDVSANRMLNVQDGPYIELAQDADIFIRNNNITCTRLGVGLQNNAPAAKVSVADNTITVNGSLLPIINIATGNGILVNDDDEVPFEDAVIRANTITLNPGFGGIMLNGTNSLTVENNPEIRLGHSRALFGILVNGAQQDTIRENTVEGFSSAHANGILAIGARSSVFACNTVKDMNYGMELRDECTGTDINTNIFEPPLGVGLLYANGGITGQQERRGNQWFGNANSYSSGFAAIHNGNQSDAQESQYTIHTSQQPFFPPSFSSAFTEWFAIEQGDFEECALPGIEVEPEEISGIEIKIAEGDTIVNAYPEAVVWDARRGLYSKLARDTSLLSLDTSLQAFYVDETSHLLQGFFEIEDGKAGLCYLNADERGQVVALLRSVKKVFFEISRVDSLYNLAPSQELLDQRGGLLSTADSLLTLAVPLDSLIRANRNARADTLVTANASLSTLASYEKDEQAVNDIYLRTIARRDCGFDSLQQEQLQLIAEQCPSDGGRTVFRARGLYHLLHPEEVFYDEYLCQSEQRTGILTGEQPQRKEALFIVFPNPGSDFLTIRYEGVFNGHTISLFSTAGQEILRQKLPDGATGFNLYLPDMKPGIYFLRIQEGKLDAWNTKVVIVD